MLINELHTALNLLANQGQSRYFKPKDKDKAINDCAKSLYEDLVEEFQRTGQLADYLIPLEVEKDLSVKNGYADLPSDYGHHTAYAGLEIVDKEEIESDAERCTSGEWNDAITSVIDPPRIDAPKIRFIDNRIQVRPKNVSNIRLSYLKRLPEAKWAFTIASDGKSYIWDETNSIDTGFAKTAYTELLKRVVTYLGIPLKDGVLIQMATGGKQ